MNDDADPSAPDQSGQFAVDLDAIEEAVGRILTAIGEDPDRDGLKDTPKRVARMYAEVFSGLHRDLAGELTAVFSEGHDEMVMVCDIPFYSMCEHHLVPFHGRAHVAYLPNDRGEVTGLSKLARLVETAARRPQVQERLTSQIADIIIDTLDAKGSLVVIEAEHLCMSMRGIKKPGSVTITSAVRGIFKTNASTRAEAMSLINRNAR